MKITKSELQQIIKEAVNEALKDHACKALKEDSSTYNSTYKRVENYLKDHPLGRYDDLEIVKRGICADLFDQDYDDCDADISFTIHNAVENNYEDLFESKARDDIDADRDDKIERARRNFDKARDDADADRDYKLKKAN